MQLVLDKIKPRSRIRFEGDERMSQEEFYDFCVANPDLRAELTAEGVLVIMPPTGGETSLRNHDLACQLGIWTRRDGRGRAFDSSIAFLLPDGSAMSPDRTTS